MTQAAARLLFSVIIPTHNRAAQFAVALQSVLDQHYRDFEVIVVDDGSSELHAAQYRSLARLAPDKVTLLTLVPVERGHGPGFARDFGAAHARGDYLCYLDDDDQWTDLDHLKRVAASVSTSTVDIDLILANQAAFCDNAPVARVIWIEDLAARLRTAPDLAGAHVVIPAELLGCQSFCHLNTTIVARGFHHRIGGFDHGLRYEEDRDYYLRAIDKAGAIKFLPHVVSRHNIPDPATGISTTTTESELSKRLYQLRVFDKATLFSTRPELRRYAMRQRGYVLQRVAEAAARAGQAECARYYGREALMAKLGLRWNRASIRLLTSR